MAVAFKKVTGEPVCIIKALSGSTTTADLIDLTGVVIANQQFFVRVWWEAKDDNDNSKGSLGMRQGVLREAGGALAINGQGNGDAPTTVGAMVTPTLAVSGMKVQMLITNDGSITGEVMMLVEITY
jgi:hypothetical protein